MANCIFPQKKYTVVPLVSNYLRCIVPIRGGLSASLHALIIALRTFGYSLPQTRTLEVRAISGTLVSHSPNVRTVRVRSVSLIIMISF
jgi:hypothetical protein